MKKYRNVLLAFVVLTCCLVVGRFSLGAEPVAAGNPGGFGGHDDVIVFHYPAALAKSKLLAPVVCSSECKDFAAELGKKLCAGYADAVATSQVSAADDAWIRKQVKGLEKSGINPCALVDEYVDYVKMIAVGYLIDPKKPKQESVRVTLTAIIAANPLDSFELTSFVQDHMQPECVFDENGASVYQVTIKDQNAYIGLAPIGRSGMTAMVLCKDKSNVVNRVKTLVKSEEFVTKMVGNEKVVKKVQLNKSFIKKAIPQLEEGFKKAKKDNPVAKSLVGNQAAAAFAKTMFDKVNSVTYLVEQKNPTTTSLTLQIATATPEDAEDLLGLINGGMALAKMQAKEKAQGEAAKAKVAKAIEAFNMVKIDQKGKAVRATVDIPTADLQKCMINGLKVAAKKMAEK